MSELLSQPWLYPAALAAISGLAILLEFAFKLRRSQRQLRAGLWSDLLHLVFNGHFLGVIIFGVATHRILPHVDAWLDAQGWSTLLYRGIASDWPVALQVVVALFAIDFAQWCVHNLLHRVPFLWEFHKTHHSVVDGEMDWIVAFRFQWTEVVVYRALLFVPLAWFGFGLEAVMFHAVFGTLIGHLNHANLGWDYGPFRYLINSPRMHLWHHDHDGDARTTVNFGIIFSLWDWVFGTAKLPDVPPQKIGFAGVECFPRDFFAQMAWPVGRYLPEGRWRGAAASMIGVAVLGAGYALAEPPAASTPMLGERGSSSRPAARVRPFEYARTPEQADARIGDFGLEAAALGYGRPEFMVSADELAAALGSPRLRIIDVRPRNRFLQGHIPSAQPVDRGDFAHDAPAPGTSRPGEELQALLRARGVEQGDVIVLYGDGGPEPYRLWWSLRIMGGPQARVLDGGLSAWMKSGHGIAEGAAIRVAHGAVEFEEPRAASPRLWRDVQPFVTAGANIIDTRSLEEFSGERQHRKAARPGRIPGARHFDWWRVWRAGFSDQRLISPEALRGVAAELGVRRGARFVTMCQSGTRSSVVYFALLQAGAEEAQLMNYDGSWAEYSRRSDLPAEVGRPDSLL